MNNFGYACINMGFSTRPKSKRITTNRTMIKRTFKERGIKYASELALQNVQAALSGEKDEELEQTLQALAQKVENLEKTLVDMKKAYANSISRNTAVLDRQ